MSRSNEFDTYLRETRQLNHFLHSFDHFILEKGLGINGFYDTFQFNA